MRVEKRESAILSNRKGWGGLERIFIAPLGLGVAFTHSPSALACTSYGRPDLEMMLSAPAIEPNTPTLPETKKIKSRCEKKTRKIVPGNIRPHNVAFANSSLQSK
jgi:hypothetical protein